MQHPIAMDTKLHVSSQPQVVFSNWRKEIMPSSSHSTGHGMVSHMPSFEPRACVYTHTHTHTHTRRINIIYTATAQIIFKSVAFLLVLIKFQSHVPLTTIFPSGLVPTQVRQRTVTDSCRLWYYPVLWAYKSPCQIRISSHRSIYTHTSK